MRPFDIVKHAIMILCFLVMCSAAVRANSQENDAGMVQIEDFFIDRYEFPNRKNKLPRVNVSWNEAHSLCESVAKRLCTEREWETACTGPANLKYGYGSEYEPGRCNVPYLHAEQWVRSGISKSGTFEDCVSTYDAFDMIGNVWEWTDGWYDPVRAWRVVRGGSWFNSLNFARSDGRYGRMLSSDYRLDLIGFRCCQSAVPDETVPK